VDDVARAVGVKCRRPTKPLQLTGPSVAALPRGPAAERQSGRQSLCSQRSFGARAVPTIDQLRQPPFRRTHDDLRNLGVGEP
jgi:hypothetical protein